jgi:hypothetical protein
VCVEGDRARAALHVVEHLTPFSVRTIDGSASEPDSMVGTTQQVVSAGDFTAEKATAEEESSRSGCLVPHEISAHNQDTVLWTKPGLSNAGSVLLWGNLHSAGTLHPGVEERLFACPFVRSVRTHDDIVVVEATRANGEVAMHIVDSLTPFRIVSLPAGEPSMFTTPD